MADGKREREHKSEMSNGKEREAEDRLRHGDSEREEACLWEMEIIHNLKWFPLPSFLHPVLCALSGPPRLPQR